MRPAHSDWRVLEDAARLQEWGADLNQTLENLARQFQPDADGVPLRVFLEHSGDRLVRLVMVRMLDSRRWLYYTASPSPLEFSRKARKVRPIPAQDVPRYAGNFIWSVYPSIYSNDPDQILRPYRSVVSYVVSNFDTNTREED